jgi:aminoglycoside phosphotransferase (APT) family kinase protein
MPAPGKLIGSGRYADVYDIGRDRVVRRYRRPDMAVDRESQIMNHARAHGVPVPEVFDACGSDIVMELLRGPTMLEVLAREPWTLWRQARLLAGLHTLVHRVPALDWLRAPFGAGSVLLHTDIHPDNVVITADGPALIDWQGAARGPAEADLAMTWVLTATGQAPAHRRRTIFGPAGQHLFARCYLAAAGPLERHWLSAATAHRLADPALTSTEAARLHRLSRRRQLGLP